MPAAQPAQPVCSACRGATRSVCPSRAVRNLVSEAMGCWKVLPASSESLVSGIA
ncbi:hypothetical protein FOMPIDRAFT_1026688 [Fomitopsis schrenkii]|uniref:Uncharacterized protein n=1 Tax=Fomitopsis schrenkii TaxID=2126942 RepID=S8DJ12_FOMSC|nr:hypothetical protein FOMPIDRAFT_1026688 [Fomitopsis schrenkii]